MPLYLYTCPKCSHQAEKLRAVGDRNQPVICAGCHTAMQRSLTAPSLREAGHGGPHKDGSGGPDQYTADVMGVPVKSLPANLRSNHLISNP